ncbi:MAG: NAD(P)/FAD-dependent oxidoreductase [Clostridiales bacterium]|jgi:thioredoxin reductase (NADPH)|nr:NAD(P)/FAD-dependent oxidoreductase [Clostridiales bacterium]
MPDVIIIGGGPAGTTAAIYTARANFNTTIIYKNYGALENAELVGNFYGFSKISGKSLFEKGLIQARMNGAKTIAGEVVGLRKKDDCLIVETENASYESKTALLATGANRDTPKITGIAETEGRGISYCAICDGFFYRGKEVAVLGSGAYALHEVEDLLPLASKITLLTNGEEPSVNFPDSVFIRKDKILEIKNEKSKILIPGLNEQKKLKSVIFETGEELPLSGLFVAVGIAGGTELARKIGAAVDSAGSVIADSEMRTSVPGLWAAGDSVGGLKQIVKASHEGAIAGINIAKFLRG